MARKKAMEKTATGEARISKPSRARHDEHGREILDPTPMQPPLGYKRTPTLSEQIAQQVRQMKLEILQGDSVVEESEDDADDFQVGDDFEPLSPYENDHIPPLAVLKKRAKEINDAIKEQNRRAAIAAHEKAIKKPVGVTTPSPNAETEPENKDPLD